MQKDYRHAVMSDPTLQARSKGDQASEDCNKTFLQPRAT